MNATLSPADLTAANDDAVVALPSAAAVPAARPGLDACNAALRASRDFAKARNGVAAWQLGSTLAAFAGAVWLVHALGESPLRYLMILPLGGLIIRLFVLQHDCGHNNFFSKSKVNEAAGLFLSFLTSMAYDAWRQAHHWHHLHQGKLSHRGIDNVNSPMTAEESRARPDAARRRLAFIRVWKIAALGVVSIMILRRHPKAYFIFWKNYRWNVPHREKSWRGVHVTTAGWVAVQALLAWYLGPFTWATVMLPATAVFAAVGTLGFWIQHNFEDSYYADDAHWSYAAAGVLGSSYIKVGPVLNWLTASIGIHHVHHLNSGIPNYRLEEARRSIPALAAVQPMTLRQLQRCFTHVFWDDAQGRMVTLDSVLEATS